MGCASAGPGGRATDSRVAGARPAAGPSEAAFDGAAPSSGQWLFRAEVSGEEGSGSLKLLLRRFAGGSFTLAAADALGQPRWEIRRDLDEAVWLDPQGRRFCRLDARLPLRATQWVSNVQLADLPGLLTGEWPAASEVEASAAESVVASAQSTVPAGRRITGIRGALGWTSWTLWEAGIPAAWFKRLASESLLSVRRPAVQVRWRLTAQGPLGLPTGEEGTPFTLLPAELVASSREIECPGNAIP